MKTFLIILGVAVALGLIGIVALSVGAKYFDEHDFNPAKRRI